MRNEDREQADRIWNTGSILVWRLVKIWLTIFFIGWAIWFGLIALVVLAPRPGAECLDKQGFTIPCKP